MTTSHAPAKIASTTMELIGHTSTTMPAITIRTPTKMYQPRSGIFGRLIANTDDETPWKMNPIPIHRVSSHTAEPLLKSRKANTPRTTESAPLMNNRTRLAADE
jgi:hypothetical protein